MNTKIFLPILLICAVLPSALILAMEPPIPSYLSKEQATDQLVALLNKNTPIDNVNYIQGF